MTKKLFYKCIFFIILVLVIVSGVTIYLDPFFHYHAPLKGYYYRLYDQRMQNDGITRTFDYDTIITGTSMAENFKASLADELFDARSIKVCYSGATYKELGDNIRVGLENNSDIKYVISSFDTYLLDRDKDELRYDLGEYPTYMYNDNPVDDVKYLFNRDVLLRYTIPMIYHRLIGKEGGHTSFDDYSSTYHDYKFGAKYALDGTGEFNTDVSQGKMTDEQRERVLENIKQNVCALAADYPDTTFYYFIPPYSMVYWGSALSDGEYEIIMEMQELAITELLEYDNIRLFSYDLYTEITGDLDNYRDHSHYGYQINDLILEYMSRGEGLLTKDNYKEYLDRHREIHLDFDYDLLFDK